MTSFISSAAARMPYPSGLSARLLKLELCVLQPLAYKLRLAHSHLYLSLQRRHANFSSLPQRLLLKELSCCASA